MHRAANGGGGGGGAVTQPTSRSTTDRPTDRTAAAEPASPRLAVGTADGRPVN